MRILLTVALFLIVQAQAFAGVRKIDEPASPTHGQGNLAKCQEKKARGELERIALVVGNNKLLNFSIQNGLNDARLVGGSLEKMGFEVALSLDPTSQALRAALDDFKTRIDRLCSHDVVVFYYAGNGFEIGRMSYIATIDVEEPTKIDSEFETLRKWIRLSDVLDSIRNHPGPKVVLIDTCRTYELRDRGNAIGNPEFAPDLNIPKNILIAYSTEPYQYASDGPGQSNGPYAIALTKYLSDPRISIEDALRLVRADVDRASKGRQIPFMESGLREEVYFNPQKSSAPLQKPATIGRRIALVIGNAAYTSKSVDPLDTPINDATDVAAALRRIGFEVKELHDADQKQMRGAVTDFDDWIEAGERAEVAVIYYAGHGIARDVSPYLVPVDAQLKSHTVIDQETVPVLPLIGTVSKAGRLGLLIIDACRNNPFQKQLKQDALKRNVIIATGLPAIEPNEDNVLVAYSAKHGQQAWDGEPGARNSPFIQALLETIERPGIDIEMTFRMVRDGVKKRTQNDQQPYTYASLPGIPIYLVAPAR